MMQNSKILKEIQNWGIKETQNQMAGGLQPWSPEIAKQFKDEFDSNLETILHNPYFLGLKSIKETDTVVKDNCLYPSHKDDILAIYEEKKKRDINLVILIEGIGSGKSTVNSILTYLEWFRLTCTYNPQKYYGMMNDEIIAFIAMSRSEAQAKRVTLQKIYPKFQTQFNIEYFPPSKRRGQEIWIPRNNTLIFAGTSNAASALGYNIFGGVVDECVIGDTLITLSNKQIKIKDLEGKKNIKIKTFNIGFNSFENSVAEDCICRGEKDVWEIELENGDKVEATEKTLFLCKEINGTLKYKYLIDIKEGDDIVTING
jgi:hypothetical protein